MAKSKRILIVVHDERRRELARASLTNEGYEVMAAENATDAEALILFAPPQLILLEILHHLAGGLALARSLKISPRTRGIVIVALIEEAATGDDQLALDAGCDAAILRPTDRGSLPRIVGKYLTP